MTSRTALYGRVSTARQERDETLASQLEALERAASALGVTVPAERRYLDDGVSGSRLDRAGLDALRDAAADGLIDRVLIYCPDRLARNYVHQHVLIEELNQRGVEVHFVEHPVGERAEDRLLVQMQGVIAEYERAKIIERTRRGRLHRLRSGQMVPYGSVAPYGYAVLRTGEPPRRMVVIDEIEAEHVRAMYHWVLDEGLSMRGLAKRLNTRGIRPRKAQRWTSTTVYQVLTNPAYVGRATYNRREAIVPKRPRHPGRYRSSPKSSRRRRPPEEWIQVPIPALIDDDLQRDVLAVIKSHKRLSMRNTQHEYLLRTLVTCGECGRRMASSHQNRRAGSAYEYFYYHCRHEGSLPTEPGRRCTARRVRRDELDALVWDTIATWIQSPSMLTKEIEAWRASRVGTEQATRDRARLEGAARQLAQQIGRLVDAYQGGALSVDELKARRERLEAARDATYERLAQLAGAELDRARLDRLGGDLATFADTLRTGIDQLDFHGRQRLVRLLLERVVVTGDHVAIEHAIPLSGRFCRFASAPARPS